MSVWLIGAGPHACAYAKVLNHLGTDYEAIGRSAASACQFNLVTGKTIRTTGVSGALLHSGPPETAIVAVSFDQLACVAISLISAGTKRILLEKPGALGVQEMAEVAAAAKKHKAAVWIAYNRRYYASTRYALEMIKDDGGPVSCNFEFTEWPHIISPWVVPAKVKDSLVIANSSHVIDLAFYICGLPDEWQGWRKGSMPWHKTAARFCGAGVTKKGILFSYHADWEAPGRWGVEILTRKHRFFLKPLEQLHITNMGSVEVKRVHLDDHLDLDFKPGLFRQTKAFLDHDCGDLCSLDDQVEMMSVYSKMAGYTC